MKILVSSIVLFLQSSFAYSADDMMINRLTLQGGMEASNFGNYPTYTNPPTTWAPHLLAWIQWQKIATNSKGPQFLAIMLTDTPQICRADKSYKNHFDSIKYARPDGSPSTLIGSPYEVNFGPSPWDWNKDYSRTHKTSWYPGGQAIGKTYYLTAYLETKLGSKLCKTSNFTRMHLTTPFSYSTMPLNKKPNLSLRPLSNGSSKFYLDTSWSLATNAVMGYRITVYANTTNIPCTGYVESHSSSWNSLETSIDVWDRLQGITSFVIDRTPDDKYYSVKVEAISPWAKPSPGLNGISNEYASAYRTSYDCTEVVLLPRL